MINENYLRRKDTSYLFAGVMTKARAFSGANPEAKLIYLNRTDVALPLSSTVTRALSAAAESEGAADSFRGYGPEEGYAFFREAVSRYYASRGVSVEPGEVFASPGAKEALTALPDIFSNNEIVLVSSLCIPVYAEAAYATGRPVVVVPAREEDGFLPLPNENQAGDILYLASPNLPTGTAFDREMLGKWVEFANKNRSVILYDAAYERFMEDSDLPRSIFEIPGARNCAIEIGSLSKCAGFTGLRCGYVLIPAELERDGFSLQRLWLRHQITASGGVSYPIQCAAVAALSEAGRAESREQIGYYRENAAILSDALRRAGVAFTGGRHAPHLFLRCPSGMTGWDFFDTVLEKAHIVGTPGLCFGEAGRDYFCLSALCTRADAEKGAERLEKLFSEIF